VEVQWNPRSGMQQVGAASAAAMIAATTTTNNTGSAQFADGFLHYEAATLPATSVSSTTSSGRRRSRRWPCSRQPTSPSARRRHSIRHTGQRRSRASHCWTGSAASTSAAATAASMSRQSSNTAFRRTGGGESTRLHRWRKEGGSRSPTDRPSCRRCSPRRSRGDTLKCTRPDPPSPEPRTWTPLQTAVKVRMSVMPVALSQWEGRWEASRAPPARNGTR